MVTKVMETLEDREGYYGSFTFNAKIARQLKSIVLNNTGQLNNVQHEALDMIMTKIARIISGNPNHRDSWHDIAGYATLVEETLK